MAPNASQPGASAGPGSQPDELAPGPVLLDGDEEPDAPACRSRPRGPSGPTRPRTARWRQWLPISERAAQAWPCLSHRSRHTAVATGHGAAGGHTPRRRHGVKPYPSRPRKRARGWTRSSHAVRARRASRLAKEAVGRELVAAPWSARRIVAAIATKNRGIAAASGGQSRPRTATAASTAITSTIRETRPLASGPGAGS